MPSHFCSVSNPSRNPECMVTLTLKVNKYSNCSRACNGLFTLPDSDSDLDLDSDSKLDGYIVPCKSFHIGSDLDPEPYLDGFPNGFYTHFRDGSLSRTGLHPNFTIFRSGDQRSNPNQWENST